MSRYAILHFINEEDFPLPARKGVPIAAHASEPARGSVCKIRHGNMFMPNVLLLQRK